MPLSFDEFGVSLIDDIHNRQDLSNPFGFAGGFDSGVISGLGSYVADSSALNRGLSLLLSTEAGLVGEYASQTTCTGRDIMCFDC